jgi:hypothetical protein
MAGGEGVLTTYINNAGYSKAFLSEFTYIMSPI